MLLLLCAVYDSTLNSPYAIGVDPGYLFSLFAQSSCRIEDCVHGEIVTETSVHHQMEAMAVRPFDFEVLFDELGAFEVHLLDQRGRFLFAFPFALQATHLVIERSVDESMECVAAVSEVIGGAASNDHAVTGLSQFFEDDLHGVADAIGIHHLQSRRVECSFEAAAQERFEEPVITRVAPLFALLDSLAIAIHAKRDLVRQPLVPKFPAQTFSDFFRDHRATAPIFAINGDDSNHDALPHPTATSPPPPGSFLRNRKDKKN